MSLHGDIMQNEGFRETDLQRIWQTRTTHAHIFKFVVDTHICKKKTKQTYLIRKINGWTTSDAKCTSLSSFIVLCVWIDDGGTIIDS